MAKDETIRERLKGVETELYGFRELMEQREKTSNARHNEIVKRLDTIASNGKDVAHTKDISEAIIFHSQTCVGRVGNGTKQVLRENWKVITALLALTGTLSGALVYVLEMLKPLLSGS